MSLSSTMPIIERQKQEVEEARRTGGDQAAKEKEREQSKEVIDRFKNAASMAHTGAHIAGPAGAAVGGIWGFLTGGGKKSSPYP